MGIAAEIIPKGVINLGQSLSRPPGDSSLYTREPLGTGDADCRVGPAGLLAMTVLILYHSEASAHTGRGNPSFLRWTGVRAAVPRAWPPPAKFRPQHRAAASSAPTKRRDSCRNHPSQRRAAKRPRPRPRGMGGNRRKDHPKRGTAPRPPGQRLAKRKARKEQLVKFSLCPIPSECSTAYRVRKFAKGPARVLVGAALIGQNGLEPRPAAREGAPRP